jgi:cell division protein FtsA
MKNNCLVGIDVGSKKICTVIGQVKNEDGKDELEIIGYGLADSHESSYVNISGSNIETRCGKGSVNVSGRNGEITTDDVERAVTHGSGMLLPQDRETLHVLTQEFFVDSQEDIKNPIGMVGNKLDVNVVVVTSTKASIKNLLICLKKAKIDVIKIILSHIATAEAVLTPDERELGVALIDIGGGTTDFSVFEKGALSYAKTFPVGGYNFTNDLAIGIRTPIDKAEIIKRRYGCGIDPNWQNQNIEIPSVGGKKKRMISVSLLSDILRPRAEEIKINAGIVLTGGSASLDGILEVADEIFSVPIRVGTSFGLGGLIDKVSSPDFASSVGLLKCGLLDMKNKGVIKNKPEGLIVRFKKWLGF